ncbi:DUF2240 family protein [Halobaculum sp. MBLA0147]|uniref:DUF2240 family protein n=1 Tax=Halobaculum sp. MBLA0147 TaxID=3079934 RepID=UPI0035259B22
MSLKTAVAVPFRSAGTRRLGEGEFVVALSLDRDWFSPDQAKRLVDIAEGRGLLAHDDGELVAEFEPSAVSVPEDFEPGADVLTEQSTFERVIDRLVDDGTEKREAVAAANERQSTVGVSLEAAAVLVARERGVEVDDAAAAARADLLEGEE